MAVQLKPEFAGSPERRPPPGPLTYEQFLEWADEDTYAEWVGGEVVPLSPASEEHQALSIFVTRLLAEYAEEHDAGRVLTAPFQMRLPTVERGREPDVLFVTTPNLARLQRTFLDGAADLAVEIVSPESVLRDRGEKYAEYEIEGVREYWVLDPEARRADFFVLGGDGRYERRPPDAGGLYHSPVLAGFWVSVAWLWQRPLPPLRDVVREWERRSVSGGSV